MKISCSRRSSGHKPAQKQTLKKKKLQIIIANKNYFFDNTATPTFLGSLGRQRSHLHAIYLKRSAEKDQHAPAVTLTTTSPFGTISLASIHRQLDVSLWVKIHSNGQR